MNKVLVKYLKGFDLFVPGDVRVVSIPEYKELKKKGLVEKTEILEELLPDSERVSDELLGFNILGKKYTKKIDVVVPTENIKNVISIKELKKAEKGGLITLNIIERNFCEQNGGFAKACNDGALINKGLGEYILFLNDDVKIGENFFADLILPFNNSNTGLVGCECSKTSWGVNGSVMCIRRELFERFGGFDENYFFMWEDNDICQNVRLFGFDIAFSKANAQHSGRDSANSSSEFWRVNYYNGFNYYQKKWSKNRIIGSMIMGNENDRYLKDVIDDLLVRDLVDELVIIFDNSNNETVKEVAEIRKRWANKIITFYHDFSLFGKAENLLRERATYYAMARNAFGIVPVDADEKFDEELSKKKFLDLLNIGIAYDFVLAHFFGNKDNVRIDGVFAHQKNIRLFRVSYGDSQKFYDRGLHCGSAPIYAYQNRKDTDYILKHYGYVKKADIVDKKKRQIKYDNKMVLENPDLYNRMIKNGEVIKFNKKEFLEIWKK